MPVGRALIAVDRRIPYPERAFTFHFESVGEAHDIDRVSAATRALAADRAIAALIWVRRVAVDAEGDRAAATGAFETHRHLNLIGALLGARKVPDAIIGRGFRHPGHPSGASCIPAPTRSRNCRGKRAPSRSPTPRRDGLGAKGGRTKPGSFLPAHWWQRNASFSVPPDQE